MYYLYTKFCKILLGWENRGKKKEKENLKNIKLKQIKGENFVLYSRLK